MHVSLWIAVPALLVLLAVHFFWLWQLHKSEGRDRQAWTSYHDKAVEILEPGKGPSGVPGGGERPFWISLEAVATLVLCIFLVVFLWRNSSTHANTLAATKWRFVVSGDSRNCGDIVVPAIAAQSARFAPEFYWHLGDLRAIFKIDEDMEDAARKAHQPLACETYERSAWDDFIQNQIGPFGNTPFYVGIGNHETIGRTEDQFVARFAHWLSSPVLQKQRQEDGDPAPSLPQPYYHWIQGGVDFIYLDNASGIFSPKQLDWFDQVLAKARTNDRVGSVVVGMHEALPDSIARDHSMCDNSAKLEGCTSGRHVYQKLLEFQRKKPVYVLASHQHYFMDKTFSNLSPDQQVPGWIVGTAGAIHYQLPSSAPKPESRDNTYGYLIGAVNPGGRIDFDFQEIKESDVPEGTRQRYSSEGISWCFTQNSKKTNAENSGTVCMK